MLVLILALLIAVFALDASADLLNIRAFPREVPPELREAYPEEKRERSERYLRETTAFGLVARWVSLAALLIFMTFGGFGAVDRWVRGSHFGIHFTGIVAGVAYAGTLSFLSGLLNLPFGAYETFIIERNFGFNRTTFRTFCGDSVKGTLIGIALGAPTFALILYVFGKFGPGAWIWAWLFVVLLQLAVTFLAPALIFPLFNRFEPLPEGDLHSRAIAYLKSQKIAIQGLFVMDASRRSTKGNAFFAGFGRLRKLVLFDTLIQKHGTEEIVAILAHEVGHFRRHHILKMMSFSIITSALLFWAASLMLGSWRLANAFGTYPPSIYANLIFIAILYSPVARLLSIAAKALSRRYEFEADAFGSDTSGTPDALARALLKLGSDHLSHPAPHPWKVMLDYSHPPLLDRLRRLSKKSQPG